MTTEICPTVQAWDDAGRPHPYATFRAGYDVAVTNFLETTGKYVTNDASREAAIKEAVELDRQQRGESLTLGQQSVAQELLSCFEAWEPGVRVLGNVQAKDGADLMRAILVGGTAPQPAEPVVNQSLTTEREAFESDWAARHYPIPLNSRRRDDGEYGDGFIEAEWRGFQARAALAQPTAKQPLQPAEAVKGEPSGRTQPLLDMLETLCTGLEWNIENHPDVMNESDSEALHAARALLARYQGAQPAASANYERGRSDGWAAGWDEASRQGKQPAASADPWRPSNAEALAWAERHLVENTLKGEAARCAIDDARSLHMLAAPVAAQADMVSVTQQDANNYCRILSVLGMEEEGDPVAEVERLVAAQPSVPDFTEDLSKMCRRLILDVRALADEEGPEAARLSRANQALKWLQSRGLAGSPLRDIPTAPAGEHPDTQAIRDAALEDAAAACRQRETRGNSRQAQAACRLCAKAIRALKSQPGVKQYTTKDVLDASANMYAPGLEQRTSQDHEDAERLQWLESIGTVDIVHDLDGLVEIFDPNDVTLYATGSTLRAAIDAARAAKEPNHG